MARLSGANFTFPFWGDSNVSTHMHIQTHETQFWELSDNGGWALSSCYSHLQDWSPETLPRAKPEARSRDSANLGLIRRGLWGQLETGGPLASLLILIPPTPGNVTPVWGSILSCQRAHQSPPPRIPRLAVHWHTASITTVCWKNGIHLLYTASYITDHSLLPFQAVSSNTINESVPQGHEMWQSVPSSF